VEAFMLNKVSIVEAIFETSEDGILFCDTDGIIKLWNRGCERIFGYTESEAIGKSLDIIVPQNMRQKHWDGFNRALSLKHTKYAKKSLSVVAMHKDGISVPIDFRMNILEKDEKTIGIFAIIRDVAETTTPFFS
jgi:PAS domain S-box-containing protein